MLKSTKVAGLLAGLLCASASQAASVSYFLDQSNKLDDGINYLQVTISDDRLAGVVDFKVEVLQPLQDLAGDKSFGIIKFAFNIVGGTATEAEDVSDLPKTWRARDGGRMDGFGLFDVTMKGTGTKGRLDPLIFSVSGVDLDTIQSYVDLSTGRAPEGFSLFAAEVRGLDGCSSGGNSDSDSDGGKDSKSSNKSNKKSCSNVHTAYFGGVTPAAAVPAPPAVWLLGTAVAGLAARRLRRASRPA